MNSPITKCETPREGRGLRYTGLSINRHYSWAVIVITIVVMMMVEFCGECGCAPCLKTFFAASGHSPIIRVPTVSATGDCDTALCCAV